MLRRTVFRIEYAALAAVNGVVVYLINQDGGASSALISALGQVALSAALAGVTAGLCIKAAGKEDWKDAVIRVCWIASVVCFLVFTAHYFFFKTKDIIGTLEWLIFANFIGGLAILRMTWLGFALGRVPHYVRVECRLLMNWLIRRAQKMRDRICRKRP